MSIGCVDLKGQRNVSGGRLPFESNDDTISYGLKQ